MHNYLKTKYYFINKFDTNNINRQDKQTVIIYRNYSSTKVDEMLILKIKKYCKKKGNKFFLSNSVKIAIKLGLDGVYIPSFNKNLDHLCYSINTKFEIIGSAHNLREIKTKELQNVNKIFLSSLFKKNKNFLGINKFKLLSKLTKKKIVILGGISRKNIRLLKLLTSSEFAGISFFE
ncbi:thiamine phosphate synthase [Candidatus Pelagibacter sp.]|jgi:thiamine-phosphate pyrophosphorylase|nr:thiamine phosphate synthase [Candidatus Pelagibacter sp.]|tara:strand:+ start:4544 stop:5074 length:531 start_codon:yes stop_codon:yes gene_type:complete